MIRTILKVLAAMATAHLMPWSRFTIDPQVVIGACVVALPFIGYWLGHRMAVIVGGDL